jgi:hypothetical protein
MGFYLTPSIIQCSNNLPDASRAVIAQPSDNPFSLLMVAAALFTPLSAHSGMSTNICLNPSRITGNNA